MRGTFPSLRSAGWAAIVMPAEGRVIAQAREGVPLLGPPSQTARAGEDSAAVTAHAEIVGSYEIL
eukprot:4470494-Pyramimonas_sp.AAC.1